MITKENYENALQKLNERFDKLKAEMIEAYEKVALVEGITIE